MKKIIYIILPLVLALTNTAAYAQSIEKGKVVQYNGREAKTALGGVEIQAANAGSTVSGAKGNFTLNFKKMKPGDKIMVTRLEKTGYILFNKEAVEQWHISRTGKPFSIVMCKEEKYREIRNNYERISSESYAKQMKIDANRLDSLRRQNKITESYYKKRLNQLQNKYETQLENLDTYIDRVSRIDLSELSAKENAIITLMQQGKVDEALKAYEEMDLEGKLKQEIKTIGSLSVAEEKLNLTAQENRQTALQTYEAICRKNDLLYLAGGLENIRKIKRSLKQVAFADTTFSKAMIGYITFLTSQREYTALKSIIPIAERNATSVEELMNIKMEKYAMHSSLNEKREASLCIIEMCDIIEKNRSQFNGLVHAAYIVGQLIVIGSHEIQKERFTNAIHYYKQAINLNVSLCKDLPEVFDLTLAQLAMEHLCYAYLYTGQVELLEKTLIECEQTLESLPFDKNGKDYLSQSATLYMLKGSHAMNMGDYTTAQSMLDKTIAIYKDLTQREPGHYDNRLADTYGMKGEIYCFEGKYEDALRASKEMLHYIKDIESKNENTHIANYIYATAAEILGMYSLNKGDYENAKKHFENALSIAEATDKNISIRTTLGLIYYGLCMYYKSVNKKILMALYRKRALAAIEEFHRIYPKLFGGIYDTLKSLE